MTTDPDSDRRAALFAAKLRAVARRHWQNIGPEVVSGPFPGGATLMEPATKRGWLLLDDQADRRLGAALALASRSGVTELHLLVDDADQAAVLARRAGLFATPPSVWIIAGAELRAAVAAPPATDPAPAPGAELYRPVLVAAGLDPVVEGGHLLGEYLGLEVARVVVVDDGTAHVEVGVGRFDREVGAMMFRELAESDALARAIAFVAEVRAPGAARHPLNQLVPERWLRSVLLAHPALVGASSLSPVGSAIPRRNLKDTGIATAIGTDIDGLPVVVCCSTGVDLELVPGAADDRLTHAPDARLILAVPTRDALAVTTELASHLLAPAEVVAVADDWRAPQGGA